MSARVVALPALALVLVAVVLGVQLGAGGGRYEPLRPADPCTQREVASRSEGIEGLAEELVLLGVDDAACRLGVTREALVLRLGQAGVQEEAELEALRAGLRSAVRRLGEEGRLPPASDLVDEAVAASDLNGFVKSAIGLVPDSLVDRALDTEDVLLRTVDELDLRALLEDVEDQRTLEQQLQPAVTEAVKDALVARLRDLV